MKQKVTPRPKRKLIKEGHSWERKSDGSLPTLSDSINSHKKKLSEVASIDFENDRYVVTPNNGMINIRGANIDTNYKVLVECQWILFLK